MEIHLNTLVSKNTSEHNISKTGVICIMAKYLYKHDIRDKHGRIPTTSFHNSIVEAVKQEGFSVEIKNVPALMMYVFGCTRIKSGGDWYYIGLTAK